MSRIHRLSSELANQIAAGEVVERPASVVKELVENAVDAGARRISIAIDFGGKKLVAVEDNGEGMDRDDAVLAVERHATSKIERASDLAAIRTLGFRGEALPSIASVSRFRLRTRRRGTLAGTELRIEGGRVLSVKDIGAPEGTLIEVEDLFFNVPARKKFLKADTAEAAQVSRLVTQLALGYPETAFTLRSAGRVLLEVPPAAGLPERFFQVYGDRVDLVAVTKRAAGVTVDGFTAALGEQGPIRGPQHVFVNRRLVKDRTIAHAIQQAYSTATIKERSPEVHLFITVPADRVDVNVHPTKAEVRFLDQGLIHEILRRAIVDALGQAMVPELVLSSAAPAPMGGTNAPLPLGFVQDRQDSLGADSGNGGLQPQAAGTGGLPWPGARVETTAGRDSVQTLIRPMTPLGQFRNTFIIAVDEEGLAIIDQHVAHERILFEQIAARLSSAGLESQRLVTPLVLDVSPGEHQTLVSNAGALGRVGFELEDFGGTAVRLTAVPALLDWQGCETALRAVVADIDGLAPGSGVDDLLRRLAATMACHAAVKANDPLTREKMQYLLDELRRTSHSSVCPHGRPVVLRLTRREIERNFERV